MNEEDLIKQEFIRENIERGSTNDALGAGAENIGRLLARKHYYFVPFGQDDPEKKPASMVAHFEKLPQALSAAMEGRQFQPILQ